MWLDEVPAEQWTIYRNVIATANTRGVKFAIGGGFARDSYLGQVRNTKDLDIFIKPGDREAMIEIVTEAGLEDYYEKLPYDRKWIYRSHRDDIIVDVIWAMANQRSQVDDGWLENGPVMDCEGVRFRLVPAEETLWTKLYVMQHDRCDWPDAFNLLHATGKDLNWERLFARVGEDRPLLAAVLMSYAWLYPDGARDLPETVWENAGVPRPALDSAGDGANRAPLLDSRPWFPPEVLLEHKGKAE